MQAFVYPALSWKAQRMGHPGGDGAMSDLKDVPKRIDELKESHGPDIPGRNIPLPPKEPVQPIEDEVGQPERILPKGPAGY
jgi:hypothetical protein